MKDFVLSKVCSVNSELTHPPPKQTHLYQRSLAFLFWMLVIEVRNSNYIQKYARNLSHVALAARPVGVSHQLKRCTPELHSKWLEKNFCW